MNFLDIDEKSNHETPKYPIKVALVFHYITDGEIEPTRYEREGWFSDSETGVQWWSEYIAEDLVSMEIPEWTIENGNKYRNGTIICVAAYGDDVHGNREQVIQGKITIS